MRATAKILLLITILMSTLTASAQQGKVYNLWPSGAPNTNGNPTDTAQITVFLPDAKKATGRAVVVCPGGGYSGLAIGHEGFDWAPFFNQQGIAAIVLRYRMPRGNYTIPVCDAEEAMKTVRRNAKAWNIDPEQVGIMGFSAGGHLASTIATHARGDAKPDFQILFYPVITMDPAFTHGGSHDNFFGKGHSKRELKKLESLYSNDQQVTRATPRAFIALSDDDSVVLPANGANYYQECYRHDVPSTLHVYPTGGHGWGFRSSFEFHAEMVIELKSWLQSF